MFTFLSVFITLALTAHTTSARAAPGHDHFLARRADTSGCGVVHDWGGETHTGKTLATSSGTRQYDVYLPPNYDESVQTPLIIAFHGASGTMAKQRALDQFNVPSVNSDHMVVWVQGLDGTRGTPAWEGASYAAPGVSDKEYISTLLAHLRTAYCVDSSRIYAAGKSNGGGFTGTLACSSNEFAAFAACSGAFYTDNVDIPSTDSCAPARSPLPIMEFHGSVDTTIPYEPTKAGSGGALPQIPHWVAAWGSRNGCSSSYVPAVSKYNGLSQVQETVYTCNGKEVVKAYYVTGMAHSWPSTSSNSDNQSHGDGPTVIDASPMILDFFRANTKP